MTGRTTTVSEYEFESYQQRQWNYISEEQLRSSLDNMRYGDRFKFEEEVWTPEPYPGFAIVSMVNDNPGNDQLIPRLDYYKNSLNKLLDNKGICYFLPVNSYHQTIANTLSSERYQKHLVNTGIIDEYPQRIQQVFDEIPVPHLSNPIKMRLIGFSVFGSSMGLLGIFEKEEEYQAIQLVRDYVYDHSLLNAVDVRRTRPFIGHITYAYFGPEAHEHKDKIFQSLTMLNNEIAQEKLTFYIYRTQLRYYNNLSNFQVLPGYPTYYFYPGAYGI